MRAVGLYLLEIERIVLRCSGQICDVSEVLEGPEEPLKPRRHPLVTRANNYEDTKPARHSKARIIAASVISVAVRADFTIHKL